MKNKALIVGIILLFVGASVVSGYQINLCNNPQPLSRGWLYVGGSGPGNYTKIQDAIDDSQNGDTIYVYGGLYNETIVIPTAIRLMGESKNTTQITAKIIPGDALISISSCNVIISGFTFSGLDSENGVILKNIFQYGENLRNITILDNIFKGKCSHEIEFIGCDFCTIVQNTFLSNNSFGISLSFGSSNCILTNNSIISHNVGITLVHAWHVIISNNYFYNNTRVIVMADNSYNISILSNSFDNPLQKIDPPLKSIGLLITDSCNEIQVEKNIIRHWNIGIMIEDSNNVDISMNTFLKNNIHARFYNNFFSGIIWDQNYWGRPRMLPKPIFGMENSYARFPRMIQFDLHPAIQPYDFTRIAI